MTHYDALGVHPAATAEEIREAYRERARMLHPDRLIDASPREREEAAKQMALVNEAWHVLGDPRRRRAYDDSLVARGTRHYADTTLGDDEDRVAGGGGVAPPVVRGLPWLVLAFVLLLIFVFTAYAATGGGDGDEPSATSAAPATDTPFDDGPAAAGAIELGDCVVIDDTVEPVDCDAPNDGQVVADATSAAACPTDTEPVLLRDERRVICVAR